MGKNKFIVGEGWYYLPDKKWLCELENMPDLEDEDIFGTARDLPEILYKTVNNRLFHVGYHKKPAKTIICKRCGSDKFHVGSDDFWTGIKCPNCGWELAIHEG